jgi:hypothetical protein
LLAQGMGGVSGLNVYDNCLAEALKAGQNEVSAHFIKFTGVILRISLTFARWQIIMRLRVVKLDLRGIIWQQQSSF